MPTDNFKFLVLGAGRGGTSLIAGLLDYHSELTVAYELCALAYLNGEELPYRGHDLFGKRVQSFIAGCQNAANQRADILWGNKITTEQLFGLEDHNVLNPDLKIDVLDEFFNNHLKNVKVIFILRDGRTCINSKIQRTGQPIEKAAERWKYSVTCYRFFKTRHSNNICIRFEDMLFHPEKTLTQICDFLNVPYQDAMLLGTNNKKMLPEYRQNKFDLTKTKSIVLPDHIMTAIKEDLEYCGYS